jgi:hypothetical protein
MTSSIGSITSVVAVLLQITQLDVDFLVESWAGRVWNGFIIIAL